MEKKQPIGVGCTGNVKGCFITERNVIFEHSQGYEGDPFALYKAMQDMQNPSKKGMPFQDLKMEMMNLPV